MTIFTRAFLRTASPNYLRNTRDMPAIVRTPHPRERRIVFKNIDRAGWTTDIDCYLKDGGYEELKKVLNMSPKEYETGVKAPGPPGRAAVGFRWGLNGGSLRPGKTRPFYLSVN